MAAATKLREGIQGADIGATNGMTSRRGSLKVLDVLWQLVCDGNLFFGANVTEDYQDWGSKMAWEAYANQATLKGEREPSNGLWSGWVKHLVPETLKRKVSWMANSPSSP